MFSFEKVHSCQYFNSPFYLLSFLSVNTKKGWKLSLYSTLCQCVTQRTMLHPSQFVSFHWLCYLWAAYLFILFLSGRCLIFSLSSLTSISPLLLSPSLSVCTEKARIIPPVDFHLTESGLLLNFHWLKPLLTPKLFMRHKWLKHMGWAEKRVMSEIEKRERTGGRESWGREGEDKQDEGLCFVGSKQVHCPKICGWMQKKKTL